MDHSYHPFQGSRNTVEERVGKIEEPKSGKEGHEIQSSGHAMAV